MNAATDLLRRAYRYRHMADQTIDEQARKALLELAEKYEALARDIQPDGRLKPE